MEKAAWAIFLVRLLRLLDFFPDRVDLDHFGPDELLIGRLAEHFLRVADDNCHEICQVEAPSPSSSSCSSLADMVTSEKDIDQVVVVVGVAIYLKSSLFNNRLAAKFYFKFPGFLVCSTQRCYGSRSTETNTIKSVKTKNKLDIF